eukprot:9919877-Alexandrium_andersonii.AAC.1
MPARGPNSLQGPKLACSSDQFAQKRNIEYNAALRVSCPVLGPGYACMPLRTGNFQDASGAPKFRN